MPEQVPAAVDRPAQFVPRQVEHCDSAAEPSQRFGEVAPLCRVLQRSAQPPAVMSTVQAQSQLSLVSVADSVSDSVDSVSVDSVSVDSVSVDSVSVLVAVLLHATPNAVKPPTAATAMPI